MSSKNATNWWHSGLNGENNIMEIIIGLAAAIFFLIIICITLLCKISDKNRTIERQKLRISYLQTPLSRKDHSHAHAWENLWHEITDRFNIYTLENGQVHGGIDASEINKLMRSAFGSFSLKQIRFISNLIVLLKKVINNQEEYAASLNPIGKEIIFTAEGGIKITEPSRN